MRLALDPDHIQIPLESVQVFVGHSKRLTFTNVPKSCQIVAASICDVSGEWHDIRAERGEDGYTLTIPCDATKTSGISKAGLKIFGYDAAGDEELLGWADFVVLKEDGSVTPVSGGIEHKDFAGIEDIGADATTGDVKRKLNEVIGKLKGEK